MNNELKEKNKSASIRHSSGQVMLMTTVVISATLLAATTLAGVLMISQLRQTANVEQSTRGIFAADAGLEYELYRFYQDKCSESSPSLANEAVVETQVSGGEGTNVVIRSQGSYGRAIRAFSLNLGPLSQSICD
ncbi:MAG: hypothetical protein COU09_00250 [Candidatus Harrisonbacteria bacterium CG10_big_fil_rev_8_21_14_0_10_44_23]|uniref:Type 4 fimbrial biogenesis protein PilX N-terminal domain-containing protein n=1 Tax=Candidatus Harrisonbacteria bacterium CG10_big_fil_rev_8_21_14_0_10_44_23 TaxID=1974585 RepID=A0A2H0USS3_9BACT|nr:MAG: hypothetical protein COU09_00250 [Candidatus Harrisonbacteria bacterium CG10_big_fil_rev_8_21_14_0_10_44_23]